VSIGRVARAVLGGGIERELLPLIVVSVPSTLGFGAFWVFVGVWATHRLGATPGQLGLTLFVEATLAAAAGYVAGWVSDRVGRRVVLVGSMTTQAGLLLLLAFVAHRPAVGLPLLVCVGISSGPGIAASGALVADLVPAERRENAYASMRVVFNVAMVCGPPLAGFMLAVGGWTGFLLLSTALGATAAVGAAVLLPPGRIGGAEEEEAGSILAVGRDRPYLVFLGSSVLAWVVYTGYENALPIAATTAYGLAPSTWGFVVALNPALVALFQLRLTNALAAISPRAKLAIAIPVMGLSFLAFLVDTSIGTIACVVTVFVFGEMLWAPTATAAAAAMAPANLRGAYMGAYGGTTAAGFAVGPLVGLQLLGGPGPETMWAFFAAVSIAAAAGSALAVPTTRSEPRSRTLAAPRRDAAT
jgi:MFS family permease